MATAEALELSVLYERDETAWLEAMSALAASGCHAEMDYQNLSEYLADMARRDRREVFSRLVMLLTHLLKWEYQPETTLRFVAGHDLEQRRELSQLLESGTLRNHAAVVLADAYAAARRQAAARDGTAAGRFPHRRCTGP